MAHKNAVVDDETILNKFNELMNIFSSTAKEKMEIENIIFTKFIDNGEKLIKDSGIRLSEEIKSQDLVGLKAKYDKAISDDLLLCSYFKDYTQMQEFFNNISDNIFKLYNISI